MLEVLRLLSVNGTHSQYHLQVSVLKILSIVAEGRRKNRHFHIFWKKNFAA